MDELRVGSLFSGIGGFDLGLERTGGFHTVWFCEQDPYCQRVLGKHWPGVPVHHDVTALRHPEPVDVVCGGFPCQDLSVAGAGAGLDGARSGLWSEYARLVGELRPRYVIVENVPALLGRGLGRVLADLAALGYDAEWDCIPAAAIGAPHRRDRLWLVAYPGCTGSGPLAGSAPRDEGAHEGRTSPHDHLAGSHVPRHRQRHVADAAGLGRGSGWPGRPAGSGSRQAERPHRARVFGASPVASRWPAEPDVPRMAHGLSHGVDRGRALGNALVPCIPEWIGQRILDYEGGLT